MSNQADIAVVGGVDTLSDVPLKFSKPIRERLLQVPKVSKKGTMATLGLMKGMKMKDLIPEAPAIANYTTGMNGVNNQCIYNVPSYAPSFP